MKSFTEYHKPIDEGVLWDMTKDIVPEKLLHIIKRMIHKDAYKKVLKLQREILKDKSRDMSPQFALVKAAELVGVNPREIMKVLDKETRYK